MAYVGASSHFGISSFLTLGGQTLSFINVTSFHLALVGDLKRKQSSLFFIPFVFTPLFSSHKKPQFLEKWRVLLPQVPTPQKMTRIHRALAMLLQWLRTLFLLFLILPSFLPPPPTFSFLRLGKPNLGRRVTKKKKKKKKIMNLKTFRHGSRRMLKTTPTVPSWESSQGK